MLTIEHFIELDATASQYSDTAKPALANKHIIRNFFSQFAHLKGIFLNRLQALIFVLLGIAYMVSSEAALSFHADRISKRATTGHSTWRAPSFHLSCFETTCLPAKVPSPTPTANTSTSTSRVSSAPSWVSFRFSFLWSGGSGLLFSRRLCRVWPWPCTLK